MSGGFCTDGAGTGAFSNAALAAQALSDVSQSASLEGTATALEAISARRRVEQQGCDAGFELVGGVCRPIAGAPAAQPAPRRATPRPARPAAPAPVIPAAIEPATRYATWVRVMGDYERRTGNATVAGGPLGPGPLGGASFATDSTSRTTSWGFVGGADMTVRSVMGPSDGLIFGMLVGYVDSDVRLTVNSTSLTAGIGNGSATLNAHVHGPTIGAYATYFNGPFSADLTFKVDLLSMDVSFTDSLSFNGVGTVTIAGNGATSVNNYITVGNLNYRVPLTGAVWVEPTFGWQYTSTEYSSGAAQLGLANGTVFRVQGGARFGTEFQMDRVRVRPVVTALLYDNVEVSGGFVSGGVFTNTPLGLADEGKVRGQGIFTVNLDFDSGLTAFAQAEVRGGSGLFGAGGKGGIRYQW